MADDGRDRLQIHSRTRVKDVRIAAGYTEHGWLTFLRLTREQGQRILASENPPSSWITLDYSHRMDLLAELNLELDRQGLPRVTEAIYHWRMGQALAPQIRQSNKNKETIYQSAELQRGTDSATSSFPATLEAASVVLPPIRNQPDLAQHLAKTIEACPAPEDENDQS